MGAADDRKAADERSIEKRLAGLRQELEGNEHRLFEVVELMPVPLVIGRVSDGQIIYVNAALETLFGYKRSHLVGRDASCLIPSLADRRKLKRQASGQGQVTGIEVVSRHRKGAPIWLSVWQYRFVCACKECYLTFLIDITKEKLAQQDQQEKERALAQLRELHDQDREWIACDIHDGVVQDMAGALMHLEAARRAVANGRPDAVERLGKVVQYLRDGINEARRLIDGVRPPGLDRQDLTLALGELVAKVTDSSRIPIEFIGEEEGLQLDPTVETAIYRLVQESLNNVWKHSGASRARVELTRTASGVRLTVRDWGQGFDPEKVTAERFGLSGMQQRTRLAGGTFSLKSAPGKGCKIVAEFPQQAALAPRMSKPG